MWCSAGSLVCCYAPSPLAISWWSPSKRSAMWRRCTSVTWQPPACSSKSFRRRSFIVRLPAAGACVPCCPFSLKVVHLGVCVRGRWRTGRRVLSCAGFHVVAAGRRATQRGGRAGCAAAQGVRSERWLRVAAVMSGLTAHICVCVCVGVMMCRRMPSCTITLRR